MTIKDKNLNDSIRWTGCSDNVLFGTEIARKFVNLRERKVKTRMSLLNVHNNQVGIRVKFNVFIFNLLEKDFLRQFFHQLIVNVNVMVYQVLVN
jgi:hypothetical protein